MDDRPFCIRELRKALLGHQRRLRAGDDLPSLTELADIAGIHRDTLYALMAGDRVNERSQYAISKALDTVAGSASNQRSRLLSVRLNTDGPSLHFGLSHLNIFTKY